VASFQARLFYCRTGSFIFSSDIIACELKYAQDGPLE
jgi:hypothetical protein